MVQAIAAIRKPRIIKRPRLTRMLDECGARIILLLAPAGYGKTTLAREWLSQGGRRYAWYSAGPESGDVAALAVGVAKTLQTVVPDAGKRMLERLKVTSAPSQEASLLGEMLAEDLGEWLSEVWLAIDDYQLLVKSPAAEQFFDRIASSSAQLVVTTRSRPAWGSRRRVLYGEIAEINRDLLAMTDSEANAVLSPYARSGGQTHAVASGWPAVIGLAALARGETPQGPRALDALYDYFAHELYDELAPETRLPLCQIALCPRPDIALVRRILGNALASATIREGLRVGLLAPATDAGIEIHPLLVDFLHEKFAELPRRKRSRSVEKILKSLIANECWDDALAVLSHFPRADLFAELLTVALPALAAAGRLETIEGWLRFAHDCGLDLPLLHLAEAEVRLRLGDLDEAEALAMQGVRAIADEDPLASYAWGLAGRAAHLQDRFEVALERHKKAERLARTAVHLRAAVWGQLISARHVVGQDLARLARRLEALDDGTIEYWLRLFNGRFVLATDAARIGQEIDEIPSVVALSRRAADPWVRTSALNGCAGALILAGRYSEALPIAEEELEVAEQYRLRFVLPNALLAKALALLGRRKFKHAEQMLLLVEQFAEELNDVHNKVDASVGRLKLFLARGDIRAALELADLEVEERVDPAMKGEFLATAALAHASTGSLRRGHELLRAAESTAQAIHVKGLAPCVRAVASLRSGRRTSALIRQLATSVRVTGNVDALVSSYRTYPPLLAALARVDFFVPDLRRILMNADDHGLASDAGISLPRPPPTASGLSRREREIYELLLRGMTNKEIAQLLFISPVTVKVHVRHIFQKLGVRTRVEAVSKGLT